MSASTLPLDAIHVGERHRADLGDLDALADSIRRIGLLHPVVVTPDHALVAGGRRLAACDQLGWDTIPVRVVATLTDARALLEAERDENTCRLDMAPSEKARLGKALEALERPKAAARKAIAGVRNLPGAASGDDSPPLALGKTRDIVSAAVGMSGQTYERAKAVVDAAEDDTLTAEDKAVAVEALRQMDTTGKVAGPYERVRDLKSRGETTREVQIAEAQKRRMVAALSGIAGFCKGLREIGLGKALAVCTPEEVATWATIAGECARDLKTFRGNLNGSTTHE